MKCATSSLHHYLQVHPEIAASTPKELDYFLARNFDRLGPDWYGRQFLNPRNARVAIESSPNYTKAHEHRGVPERMAALIPDVKLVYVVRDPLKRIESHFMHLVGNGTERGTFSQHLADLDSALSVQTSRYAWQLSHFLDHFPREQLRVVDYDDVAKRPRVVVRELLAWLDLGPDFDHPVLDERFHLSERKLRPNDLGLRFWHDRVKRNRARRFIPRLVGTPIERPQWSHADRERVLAYLGPDMDRLREISGLAFDRWSDREQTTAGTQ
jgi:hypothetical protein